ncbi:MAG: hotdog fold thioesterase [Eubacteriales bacterium]|nr:hotdog fold thioesterase [Eubacteriales bacterium]
MFEVKDIDIIEEQGENYAISLIPNEKNANVNGVVHGGIIFLLADEAIGRYVTSLGKKGAASDSNIHFYRPAMVGEKMTATVLERKIGKKLGVYLVEVKNEAGKLIADVMITVVFAEQ